MTSPSITLHPGAVVGGRYEALRKIGEGAFAEVWLAKKRSTGERVALKRLHGAFLDDAEVVERMRREAYFLSRVESENVVKIAELLVDPMFSVVLVMEYVEGHLLSRLMDGTLLNVEEAIDLGIDLLRGLCDLHAVRIIHRDLKPGNIILRPVSGGFHAIIFDFSLSRLARPIETPLTPVRSMTPPLRAITQTNVTLGTLEYMPPEQILDSREVDQRSDIYALGAILYTAVAGEHPFAAFEGARQLARAKLEREAPPLATSRSDALAIEFEVALARALRRRPVDRFASASEMLGELRRLRALPGDWDEVASSRATDLVRRGMGSARTMRRSTRDGMLIHQPGASAPVAPADAAPLPALQPMPVIMINAAASTPDLAAPPSSRRPFSLPAWAAWKDAPAPASSGALESEPKWKDVPEMPPSDPYASESRGEEIPPSVEAPPSSFSLEHPLAPSTPAMVGASSAQEPGRPRAGLWALLAIALIAALLASLALRHATPPGESPPTAH